jgi:hypothetical protein
MTPTLVSTIIPVFNRPVLLRDAVQSVLNQTYRPIEIIIVDDGSTDDTRQPNSGPGVARETGRLAAHGEFIQYLDSDDLLLPRKFELQVTALRSHSDCGIAYGKTQFAYVGQAPSTVPYRGTGQRHEELFPSFLLWRWWCTQTPLYRRAITDAMGPWTSLWSEEDWEYDARAGALGTRLCFCDEFVSVQRGHRPDQHLSHQSSTDPRKLADRARARELILRHAQSAGVASQRPEMQQFARALFLLSRQCGAAGLKAQSQRLLELAREASDVHGGRHRDLRLYRMAADLLGWERMGRFANWLDKCRR